jgi:hypothetical protein
MNKKAVLLLLFSITNIFSMITQRKNMHHKEALSSFQQNILHKNKFLNDVLDKNFDEIKNSFHSFNTQTKNMILASCGDAKPIFLIAELPHEQRIEVTSHLLNGDIESAELFCSLPVKDALTTYTHAVEKAQCHCLKLPVGFYYKTNNETLQLLQNALLAQNKPHCLTDTEFKQLQLLLKKEKWLSKQLGLNNTFIYKKIALHEKAYSLLTALNKNNICTRMAIFFVIFHYPTSFLLTESLRSATMDPINFLPNLATMLNPLLTNGLQPFVWSEISTVHNNYKKIIDLLSEQKKEFLN